LDVNQFEEIVVPFENVGVTLFADLTFKLFPVVARNVFSVLLHVPLCFDPVFQTLKVD